MRGIDVSISSSIPCRKISSADPADGPLSDRQPGLASRLPSAGCHQRVIVATPPPYNGPGDGFLHEVTVLGMDVELAIVAKVVAGRRVFDTLEYPEPDHVRKIVGERCVDGRQFPRRGKILPAPYVCGVAIATFHCKSLMRRRM